MTTMTMIFVEKITTKTKLLEKTGLPITKQPPIDDDDDKNDAFDDNDDSNAKPFQGWTGVPISQSTHIHRR